MKAFDWLKPKAPELKDANAEIRVIGDRSAGKTAYMASLAYWPNAKADSPVQSVTPVGNQEASAQLMNMAQNILEQGLELEPTLPEATVDEIKNYGLNIVLKEQFSLINLQKGVYSSAIRLTVNCKDYSGEFFLDLINKKADPWLDDYLDDCKFASGILLLIDGTAYRMDALYAQGIENFFASLDHRQFDETPALKRIAVALNKCELPELWVNRHEAKELIKRRFPLTSQKLMRWDNNVRQVDFFTISAFGTLGKEFPEPNTTILKRDRGGTSCVIRKPKLWRPFGLVAPIYWLCTGKRHTTLDED